MFVPNQIGEAVIHAENQIAACEVLRIFSSHKTSPLLVSEPQQGKTEVAIATAHGFIETCLRNKETYQVIVITHLSDNALRSQTRDRLEEAGLIRPFSKNPSVEVYHHSDLAKKNKIKLNDVSRRLIILDECHVALGFDRPLHAFLKDCGIDYGKAVATWQNPRNYVLSISATPYAQEMRSQLDKMVGDEQAFTTIRLKKSPDFFGIFELISSERPKQMGALLSPDKKSVSQFTIDRLQEFKVNCITYGNGYLLIRGNTKKFPKLKDYLKTNGFVYKEYSQDEANIIALSKDISQEPDYPVVILIKNALRAGKTLLSTKYIRGILESEESNPDSASQAVCRSCGFTTDDGHSKYDDKYPIYCDLKALQEAALFYNYNWRIPKGNNNSASFVVKRQFEFIWVNDRKDVPVGISLDVGTISGNEEHNIAKHIIDGTVPSARSRAWIVDGPSKSGKFQDDWDDLLIKFPDCEGRIVYAREIGLKTEIDLSEDKIDEDSLLHNPANLPIFPRGRNNQTNIKTLPDYQLKAEVFSTEEEAVKKAKEYYGDDANWIGHLQYPAQISARNPEKPQNHPISRLLNDTWPSDREVIFWFDKSHANYQNLWDEIIERHPDWDGKYVVFTKISKSRRLTVNGVNEDYLGENSLLSHAN